MLREERLWHITQRLMQERVVVSSQLSTEFKLTAATLREDLSELERRGIAKRTHGGAVLTEAALAREAVSIEEHKLAERFDVQRAEKEAIGRAAAALIMDGETIMIDGGTTTYEVARNLAGKRKLSVIASSFNSLWQELVEKGGLQVFLTGGFLRGESSSMVGEIAENMLRGFRASKAILGIDGISAEHGFTVVNFLEANVKRRMMEASQELVFVADYTKFGKVAPIPIVQATRGCTIVTDWGAPPEYVSALRERGVRVVIAEAPTGEAYRRNGHIARPDAPNGR